MSRDSTDRPRDILDCIRKTRNAARLLQQGDQADDRELVETAYAAVERHPFVIGEAAKDQPDDLRALAPEIDWRAVTGMRDLAGHEYFRIVGQVVRATVRENLDPLEAAVTRILRKPAVD